MKITLVISSLTGGGAERVMCSLANHFARAGWDVDMLTFDESAACVALEEGIVATPLLARREKSRVKALNLLRRIPRMRRHLRACGSDVCIVMLPIPTILVLAMARQLKAPIIAAERAEPSRYRRPVRFLLRRLCRRASAWIFQTETVRGWYLPHLKDVPSTIIPNAVTPAFLTEPCADGREKTIVSAGRLCPQKNFAMLIRAFARIAGDYPEHRLIIYGEGRLREELQAWAQEAGVGGRVDFPGRVEDMPQRLQRAGLFVLPSDYEGMPNALIEAMAQGLPCVATDCAGGGARYLVQDGHNGLLIPARDEDALVDALRRILTDGALAQTLGANALQVRQTLAPDVIHQRWVETVTAALAASKDRR